VLETVISVGVLGCVGSGLFGMMIESSGNFRDTIRASQVRSRTLGLFEVMRDDLDQADLATVQLSQDAHGEQLLLQVPLAMNAGAVTWGAQHTTEGVETEYPGYWVLYSLQPDGREPTLELLRQVVPAPGGTPVFSEVVARGIDQADASGPGFDLALDGSFLTVTARVRAGASSQGSDHGLEVRSSCRRSP
jgi:hypothetical protein